jgi:hypothetical protein
MHNPGYLAHYRHRPPETTGGRRWRCTERLNTLAPEALILFEDPATAEVAQVEDSGPGHRQPLLNQVIGELTKESRLRVWAGGGDLCCFLGADTGSASPADLARLADDLLANLLVGNRPLRRWRTQFLQVLRYRPDRKKGRSMSGHAKPSTMHRLASRCATTCSTICGRFWRRR